MHKLRTPQRKLKPREIEMSDEATEGLGRTSEMLASLRTQGAY